MTKTATERAMETFDEWLKRVYQEDLHHFSKRAVDEVVTMATLYALDCVASALAHDAPSEEETQRMAEQAFKPFFRNELEAWIPTANDISAFKLGARWAVGFMKGNK